MKFYLIMGSTPRVEFIKLKKEMNKTDYSQDNLALA